jgi:hypothetical protein
MNTAQQALLGFSNLSRLLDSFDDDIVDSLGDQIGEGIDDELEEEIDEEIPPLQYARSNGLAHDHKADQLAFSELAKLQKAVQQDLTDDSELHQFNFGSELKVEERVTISREGAELLSSIALEETAEAIDTLVLPMFKTKSMIKRIKFELPLLKTDHETDCKNFARRDDFEIKLCDIRLPSEMVNEENNEGLVWPSRFSSLGMHVLEELKREKISVSKDDLVHLQNALKHPWTVEDDMNLWNSEQKYKRVGAQISGLVALLTSYSEHSIGACYTTTLPIANPDGAIRTLNVRSSVPTSHTLRRIISYEIRTRGS